MNSMRFYQAGGLLLQKQIVGVYQKKGEAIDKIRDLTIEGFSVDAITIVTNRRKTDRIEDDTGVEVQRGKPDHKDDESIMNKIGRIFTDDITNPDEQLVTLGIPKEQAVVHRDDLKSGKIIIVVDKL